MSAGKIRLKSSLVFPFLSIVLIFASCSEERGPRFSADQIRAYANELYNRQLYSQAIREYQNYLANYSVNKNEEANITYIIANIYFDRLKDYENALAYYLKIRQLFPESKLQTEVSKKIVACLERLQRSEDAQQALEESAHLIPSKKTKRPGTVIAKIGDREITQGDLDFELQQLPPEIRSEYTSPEKKKEFLKRYIATELMYDTAKRKGLDRDKDVIEAAFQAKKYAMVQKLVEEEIRQKVHINDEDLELYYKANKEKYAEKDKKGKIVRQRPLSEVKSQVAQDLLLERQQAAYQNLIERMLKAENVAIYDDLIK